MDAKTVLIVEDDRGLSELLSTLVKDDIGAQAVVVGDGESALNRAHTLHPDLILLDLMIPRINGYEVCRRLKSDPSTKGIPILAMSASAGQRPEGCDAFMRKPFELDDVLYRIGTMLRPISGGSSRHAFNWSNNLDEWHAQLIGYVTKRHGELSVWRHRLKLLRINPRHFMDRGRPSLA